jgi:hypothetical protein
MAGVFRALSVVKGMSEKRRLANKRNALKSTGPKTEAGKARSRLNATKHRAYAMVCLEGEDTTRFNMLVLDLLAEYKPVGFEEKVIVQEIADTVWRKNRFKSAETLTLHSYRFFRTEKAEAKGDVGLSMAQDAAAYSTIPRCLAAEDLLDRRLWRLFDRLRKIQKKRGFHAWKSLASTSGPCASPIEQIGSQSESPLGNGPKSPETNGRAEARGDESTQA